MAIKQIVDDAQVEPTGPFLIINVLQYLETVEPGVNNLDCALAICEEMITQLGKFVGCNNFYSEQNQ